MTKRKREKRNNLRKYKAAIVFNTYGNAALADQARSWSFDRIKSELGIPIEEKRIYRVPAREIHKASTRATYYDNFVHHRINGYEPSQAFELRKKKNLPTIVNGKPIIGDEPDWMQLWRRQSRLSTWRKFSSEKGPDFPPWMMTMIRGFNREAGFHGKQITDARYGYAILFQMYVEGWSEEAAKAHFRPMDDPTIYRVMGSRNLM